MLTTLCIYLVICSLQPCTNQGILVQFGKKDEFGFGHIKFRVPEERVK